MRSRIVTRAASHPVHAVVLLSGLRGPPVVPIGSFSLGMTDTPSRLHLVSGQAEWSYVD